MAHGVVKHGGPTHQGCREDWQIHASVPDGDLAEQHDPYGQPS
jgi:hypothetical protein